MTDYLSELGKTEFPRALRGYSTNEVDNYIAKLTENYSAIYKENILLEQKLDEANEKIAELTKMKTTLDEANKRSSEIVQSAYENADGILFSIKTNCDTILREFRKKVDEQKAALDKMKEAVAVFKHELFEKYKAHIESIEELAQVGSDISDASSDEYVEKVVSTLKRDISAEYGISLDSISRPDKDIILPTGQEIRQSDDNVSSSKVGKYDEINAVLDEAARKEMSTLNDIINSDEYRHNDEQSMVQLALDIDIDGSASQ